LRNKYIDLFLIFIILLLFTGYFVYRNQAYSGLITNELFQIEVNVKNDNWQKAKLADERLKNDWQRSKNLLLFSFGSEEYLTLDNTIDKITAGIESKDKVTVLSDLLIIRNLWNNYTKIVPEP